MDKQGTESICRVINKLHISSLDLTLTHSTDHVSSCSLGMATALNLGTLIDIPLFV